MTTVFPTASSPLAGPPYLIVLGLFGLLSPARLFELVLTYSQPTPPRLLGQHSDCAFGIIPRRQSVFWAREGSLSPTIDKAPAEFLGFLFGLGHKRRNQIAEVLRPCLIPVFRRFIGVDVPQVTGRPDRRAQSDIGIAVLCTPLYRLRTQYTRNPDWRMWFLIRHCPRIHVTAMEMLAFIAPWSGFGPRLDDEVVSFVEVLPL